MFTLFRLGLLVHTHPVCLWGSEAPSKSEGTAVSCEEDPVKGPLGSVGDESLELETARRS